MTDPSLAKVVEVAREQWCSDDLEIDDILTEKDFSQADEGTWVRAWVWVPHSALPPGHEDK